MRPPPKLPAELRGRAFTTAEALTAGVTPATLRRADLPAPLHGVRSPGHDNADLHSRCAAAARALPSTAVFSHTTAVRLLGLPMPRQGRWSGPTEPPVELEVTVPPTTVRPRRQGIRSHRSALQSFEVTRVGTLAVTTPSRTWCDVAAVWSLDELVMFGDAVVAGRRRMEPGRRRPESGWDSASAAPSLAELQATAEAWGMRRGGRLLRRAGALVRSGVDSPPETDLRLLFVRDGLPEPAVNLDVHDGDGVWIHRPDLSWGRWRVGVDYDGGHHFTGEESRLRRDAVRREDLRSIGWLLPVVTAFDLYGRPAILLRRVRRALRHQGADC